MVSPNADEIRPWSADSHNGQETIQTIHTPQVRTPSKLHRVRACRVSMWQSVSGAEGHHSRTLLFDYHEHNSHVLNGLLFVLCSDLILHPVRQTWMHHKHMVI